VATGEPVGVEEPKVENPPQPEAELAEPEQPEPPESAPDLVEPEVAEPELDAEAVLTAALDSLGQAHHRPFSRA
jgi:hypothetical protein